MFILFLFPFHRLPVSHSPTPSSTKINDVILDPFLGSGTTAAVAKKFKRKWIGIEKEIIYVNEANKKARDLKLTGLAGYSKTF